jgi:hypothetical protein
MVVRQQFSFHCSATGSGQIALDASIRICQICVMLVSSVQLVAASLTGVHGAAVSCMYILCGSCCITLMLQ